MRYHKKYTNLVVCLLTVSTAHMERRWQLYMIVLCRVCLSSIDKNHSVALFSGRSASDWPRCLRTLLCVSVRESDGFPHYIYLPSVQA